jgi:hypothetical protein
MAFRRGVSSVFGIDPSAVSISGATTAQQHTIERLIPTNTLSGDYQVVRAEGMKASDHDIQQLQQRLDGQHSKDAFHTAVTTVLISYAINLTSYSGSATISAVSSLLRSRASSISNELVQNGFTGAVVSSSATVIDTSPTAAPTVPPVSSPSSASSPVFSPTLIPGGSHGDGSSNSNSVTNGAVSNGVPIGAAVGGAVGALIALFFCLICVRYRQRIRAMLVRRTRNTHHMGRGQRNDEVLFLSDDNDAQFSLFGDRSKRGPTENNRETNIVITSI